MEADGDVFSVYTEPDDVTAVAEYLTSHGYELLSAQVEMVPQTYIKLTDEGDIKSMQRCSICSRITTTSRTSGTTGIRTKSIGRPPRITAGRLFAESLALIGELTYH